MFLQQTAFVYDPTNWVAIASAVAAVVSAVFAWQSAKSAARSLDVLARQEGRHYQKLVLYIADGYSQSRAGLRFIAFLTSVSNASDSDNAIATAELRLDYTHSSGACLAVKIPLAAQGAEFPEPGLNRLTPPVRIDAHQTVAGWLLFEFKDAVIGDGRIDSYCILLTDSHGSVTTSEHSIVRELADEKA